MTHNPRQPPRISIEASRTHEAGTSHAQPSSGNSLGGLDVVIPAHLLQTVNTTVSKRDEGGVPSWDPQRSLSVRQAPIARQLSVAHQRNVERPIFLQRSSTAPSRNSSPVPRDRRRRPRASDDEKVGHAKKPAPIDTRRRSHRLSFTPGDAERLALSPRPTPRSGSPASEVFPNIEKHSSHDFANRHLSNPFADKHANSTRRSSLDGQNPFASRNTSTSSFGDPNNPSVAGHAAPEAAYVPRDARQRRGTIETIVDAIVPDALQKKLTNHSATTGGVTRQSSMRKTLEQAKLRGAEMQRNKWAMLGFEWGIYLLLTCFIYFVLIGIPLWNGAVWWLYWVVANKFVFAGGFSITLGIALL